MFIAAMISNVVCRRGVFTRLTEDASQLLIAGEASVYTTKREQFVAELSGREVHSSSQRDTAEW